MSSNLRSNQQRSSSRSKKKLTNNNSSNNNNSQHLNLYEPNPIAHNHLNQRNNLKQQELSFNLSENNMIVNSHPYNPTSQQQRCIGLNQQQQQQQVNDSRDIMANSQQNSLYGSAFNSAGNGQVQPTTQRSHMFDLANLQQSVFMSAFEQQQQQQQQQQSTSDSSRDTSQATSVSREVQVQQQQQPRQRSQNDHSLYSASSSTSLLYHIYDQINLPGEQHTYQSTSGPNQLVEQQQSAHHQLNQTNKKSNTTILNPANLFSQQTPSATLAMQLQQQHQLAELQKTLATGNNQQCYSPATTYLASSNPHAFNTLHPQGNYAPANQMLDSVLLRQQPQPQQQHHHHANTTRRPLSSSGASSMASANSLAITYGRQPRLPITNSKSSQSNLVNVLSSATSGTTLSHHLALAGGAGELGVATRHHLGSQSTYSGAGNPVKRAAGGAFFAPRWSKRLGKRLNELAGEYRTVVKCSIFLILLAFCLMSIIKFTLLSASTGSSSSSLMMNSQQQHQYLSPGTYSHLNPPPTTANQHHQQQNHQQHDNSFLSSSHHQTQPNLGSNKMFYPPLLFSKPTDSQQSWPNNQQTPTVSEEPEPYQQEQQEILKSKLLIGEFLILSQNYSHSAAQRSLLMEHITKLMDQVFLASNMRQVYSRMEVTRIRPAQSVQGGLIVECSILLSTSIEAAAQQFGLALYDSLSQSQNLLANQPNYIIDKSSIKFNIVPDKDIKEGIVPPGLVPDGLLAPSVAPLRPVIVEPTSSLPSTGSEEQRESSSSSERTLIWSEWSQWSSCIDKNGVCDPSRIHSRVRHCLIQQTGEKVDKELCNKKFQPPALQLSDCSATCSQQDQQHLQSDAPSSAISINNNGPQTAPSVLVDSSLFLSPPVVQMSSAAESSSSSGAGKLSPNKLAASVAQSLLKPSPSTVDSSAQELYAPSASPVASSATAAMVSSGANNGNTSGGSTTQPSAAAAAAAAASGAQQVEGGNLTPTNLPLMEPVSCSNCTSDEICLLLITQKVPFCAKIKDRQDESGCGGWCKANGQLCQPTGQNAFKCIHDSECLADEWRCHDSACIPLAKRCDGHSNCYDNSDERDCPA